MRSGMRMHSAAPPHLSCSPPTAGTGATPRQSHDWTLRRPARDGRIPGHKPDAHALAIVLEWSDLDARLGYRSAGSWGPQAVPGILASVRAALDRIGVALDQIPPGIASSPLTANAPSASALSYRELGK